MREFPWRVTVDEPYASISSGDAGPHFAGCRFLYIGPIEAMNTDRCDSLSFKFVRTDQRGTAEFTVTVKAEDVLSDCKTRLEAALIALRGVETLTEVGPHSR